MEEAWFPKDKVCIVGVGETEYYRWGKATKSEFRLALEAVLNACKDAGIDPSEIDGFCSYSDDRNAAIKMAAALGCKSMRFDSMVWGGGGGGGCGAVLHACLAVSTNTAKYVVAFRGLAQGQFGRFGQFPATGRLPGDFGFTAPFGLMTPAQRYSMRTRRHMHLYGTTSLQMAQVALASYNHAQRNPRAVKYGQPITIEDHQNSRMIAEPFRLYDCCQENDGAAAVILTSADRAKDLRQKPVYIMSAALGTPYRGGGALSMSDPDLCSSLYESNAKDLYERAGITPQDVDVAQLYENFTGMVIMSIEEHGFCKRGEGGPFAESGAIQWPNGKLPINTSGGNLAEAYIHGFELINEAARQMRGTSTCQVEDANICLVSSGPGCSPISDMIVRR